MNPRSRRFSVVLLTAVAVATAGCTTATDTASPDPIPVAAEVPSAPPADVFDWVASADWECGNFSALEGIAFRTRWEHNSGKIDDAAYASRLDALQDAWMYTVFGDSTVTPSLREAQRVAADGVDPDDPAFLAAKGAVLQACDAAGSIVSMGALPEMGG